MHLHPHIHPHRAGEPFHKYLKPGEAAKLTAQFRERLKDHAEDLAREVEDDAFLVEKFLVARDLNVAKV